MTELIQRAVEKARSAGKLEEGAEVPIYLRRERSGKHGHFSCGGVIKGVHEWRRKHVLREGQLAETAAEQAERWAKAIVSAMGSPPDFVKSVATSNGFINFILQPDVLESKSDGASLLTAASWQRKADPSDLFTFAAIGRSFASRLEVCLYFSYLSGSCHATRRSTAPRSRAAWRPRHAPCWS